MTRNTIDVRELGARADEIVRRVQESGEAVTITIEGRAAATLSGMGESRGPSTDDQPRSKEELLSAIDELLELADEIRAATPPDAESATEALIRMRDERMRVLGGHYDT
jgi:antitoxin (DNA-binding transcriptional repressor) of toxin-antitoxin stability system